MSLRVAMAESKKVAAAEKEKKEKENKQKEKALAAVAAKKQTEAAAAAAKKKAPKKRPRAKAATNTSKSKNKGNGSKSGLSGTDSSGPPKKRGRVAKKVAKKVTKKPAAKKSAAKKPAVKKAAAKKSTSKKSSAKTLPPQKIPRKQALRKGSNVTKKRKRNSKDSDDDEDDDDDGDSDSDGSDAEDVNTEDASSNKDVRKAFRKRKKALKYIEAGVRLEVYTRNAGDVVWQWFKGEVTKEDRKKTNNKTQILYDGDKDPVSIDLYKSDSKERDEWRLEGGYKEWKRTYNAKNKKKSRKGKERTEKEKKDIRKNKLKDESGETKSVPAQAPPSTVSNGNSDSSNSRGSSNKNNNNINAGTANNNSSTASSIASSNDDFGSSTNNTIGKSQLPKKEIHPIILPVNLELSLSDEKCEKAKKVNKLFEKVMRNAANVWRQPLTSTTSYSGPDNPDGTFFDYVKFRSMRSKRRKYFDLELMKTNINQGDEEPKLMEKAVDGVKNGMNEIKWWGVLKTPNANDLEENVTVGPPDKDKDKCVDPSWQRTRTNFAKAAVKEKAQAREMRKTFLKLREQRTGKDSSASSSYYPAAVPISIPVVPSSSSSSSSSSTTSSSSMHFRNNRAPPPQVSQQQGRTRRNTPPPSSGTGIPAIQFSTNYHQAHQHKPQQPPPHHHQPRHHQTQRQQPQRQQPQRQPPQRQPQQQQQQYSSQNMTLQYVAPGPSPPPQQYRPAVPALSIPSVFVTAAPQRYPLLGAPSVQQHRERLPPPPVPRGDERHAHRSDTARDNRHGSRNDSMNSSGHDSRQDSRQDSRRDNRQGGGVYGDSSYSSSSNISHQDAQSYNSSVVDERLAVSSSSSSHRGTDRHHHRDSRHRDDGRDARYHREQTDMHSGEVRSRNRDHRHDRDRDRHKDGHRRKHRDHRDQREHNSRDHDSRSHRSGNRNDYRHGEKSSHKSRSREKRR